jgi:FeS assembly SUF system protein
MTANEINRCNGTNDIIKDTKISENTKTAESAEISDLKEKIIEALKTIYDPEIPVNIYDLGLIYNIEIDEEATVTITMTLTTPMCPVAETFPQTVQERVLLVPQVGGVSVNLVWEPTWTKDRMTEATKLELNLF